MPEDQNQAPQTSNAPAQTENTAQPVRTEISALANYRKHKEAQGSSPKPEQRETDGQPQPNMGQQEPQREPYIPRERFDEVVNQRNTIQQQYQQMQAQLQQFQQAQQSQQVVGPTGMVQPQQAAPPPQQQAAVQSFLDQVTKDPTARQQWQKKIANEGVTALADFVRQAVESVGRPLLEEYTKNVSAQLTPIQRQYVNQQINSYVSQRANDPDFAVVRPTFDTLVSTAVQRGYDVTNPQVLGTIEFLAKQQMQAQGQYQQHQQPPTPMPFSERPGSGGQNFGKSATPSLTPQQVKMAERFGMTPQQYADSLRAMGV